MHLCLVTGSDLSVTSPLPHAARGHSRAIAPRRLSGVLLFAPSLGQAREGARRRQRCAEGCRKEKRPVGDRGLPIGPSGTAGGRVVSRAAVASDRLVAAEGRAVCTACLSPPNVMGRRLSVALKVEGIRTGNLDGRSADLWPAGFSERTMCPYELAWTLLSLSPLTTHHPRRRRSASRCPVHRHRFAATGYPPTPQLRCRRPARS